ncbi:MAG: PEGA domain-containing protein [bacterium]
MKSVRLRCLIALVAGALILGGAGAPAGAAPAVSTSVKIRVIKLARQGKRAFSKKRYDQALRFWKTAYSLWPKTQLLFNIALAHERLKQPAQAMTFLREFEREAERTQLKSSLLKAARKLFGSLDSQVSVLALRGHSGARVFVDGKLVGTVPLTVVLLPGSRTLEFRTPGRPAVRRQVELTAGRTTSLPVHFPRLRPPPRPRPPAQKKGLHMAYALSLAGLALALSGAAIGTGLLAKQRYDAFQDDPTASTRDRVRVLRDATNGLWAAAGIAGVGAVVIAIFTRWKSRREAPQSASLGVELDVGSAGLTVSIHGRY